jgi:2-oxo-4-hydroxy-4-carboxy-5-ureidoimidazoline decarboxylase
MESWRLIETAPLEEARRLLQICCGSSRWVERMVARRPFGRLESLLAAAREEWFALSEDDWREAFKHHPKIGDHAALRARFATTRHLSEREQAGVDTASDEVIAALATANDAYETRFGYIFIVCATGRTAGEMLALLHDRLRNDPQTEIRIAAEEQARITELRLAGR